MIPMSADYALVQNLGRDLALRVADAAHSLSDEAVSQLLTEDPDVARQRSELERSSFGCWPRGRRSMIMPPGEVVTRNGSLSRELPVVELGCPRGF